MNRSYDMRGSVGGRFCRTLLTAAFIFGLSAPVTSAKEVQVADLFSIFGSKDEREIGAEQHPKIVAQFGGEYIKDGLNDLVLDIVFRIVSVTDKKDIPWRATVLNSPVVNAFALPGGYVYVTRGLLALANSEAEVAGVLAHEVGHVIASHGSQRKSRATGIGLLGALAGILTQSGDVFKLGQTVGGLYLAGYSRDQEYEADQLGVKYLGLAGYPREAMAAFLTRLQAQADYAKKIAGKGEKTGQFDFFASHPQTDDRIAKAKEIADRAADDLIRDGGRDSYLAQLDGMLFGDDIREGLIDGRWFRHPGMRLKFQAPKGFQLINSTRAVYAMDGKGAQMVFDMDPKGLRGLSPVQYVNNIWMKKVKTGPVKEIQVGGAQGAISRFVVNNQGKKAYITAVVIDFGNDRVVRFIFKSKVTSKDLNIRIQESFSSFRPMSQEEAAKIKPVYLKVKKVMDETTIKDLIKPMAKAGPKKDLFLLLNPSFQGRDPVAGDMYKIPEYPAAE